MYVRTVCKVYRCRCRRRRRHHHHRRRRRRICRYIISYKQLLCVHARYTYVS